MGKPAFIKRKDGDGHWYWIAPREAVQRGYRPKTVRLFGESDEDRQRSCARLDDEVRDFMVDVPVKTRRPYGEAKIERALAMRARRAAKKTKSDEDRYDVHLAMARDGIRPEDRVVYFLRCNGFVKIGTTDDFANRLRFIRNSNPFDLEVLRLERGDEELERFYHERFAHLRHRYEWFFYDGPLADFITRANDRANSRVARGSDT